MPEAKAEGEEGADGEGKHRCNCYDYRDADSKLPGIIEEYRSVEMLCADFCFGLRLNAQIYKPSHQQYNGKSGRSVLQDAAKSGHTGIVAHRA